MALVHHERRQAQFGGRSHAGVDVGGGELLGQLLVVHRIDLGAGKDVISRSSFIDQVDLFGDR